MTAPSPELRQLRARLLRSAPERLLTQRVWIAYSGGRDSSVLLHLLAEWQLPQLRAIHVHHGLQAVADDWLRHCEQVCAGLGVPLDVHRVRIDAGDPAGPEAAARQARYAAFAEHMGEGDVLITAHHQDDQAETFLMRALRGAGPMGLGAMPAVRAFGAAELWRPLLGVSRATLTAAAEQLKIGWVDDPHNQDPRYERAWLRQQILPALRRRWPAASESLARSAALSADADELLGELARDDLRRLADGEGLSAPGLRALSPARRKNTLRFWVADRQLPTPPYAVLETLGDLLDARVDAMPCLGWPGAELRRYRDRVYLMPNLLTEPGPWQAPWDGLSPLSLPPGCGMLDGGEAASVPRVLQVSLPRGGEVMAMRPGGPRRSLKNLFQEQQVPPWQRRRTPLVFEGERLCWVGGLELAEQADDFYRRLRWQR